jgi:hemerythrin superfamily protein
MELTMATNNTTIGAQDDAIDILKRDHQTVKELFRDFATLGGAARTPAHIALVQSICTELIIHSAIEEELFYPAARNAINDDNLMNEAELEHATSRYLIEQLLPVEIDDEYFHSKVTVLREYTSHHINEEENEIFPKVRQSQLDLKTLGRQLLDRKAALQKQLTTPELLIAFRSPAATVEVLIEVTDDSGAAAPEPSAGTDAIAVLTDDHNRVRGLFRYFAQLEGDGPTTARMNVVEDICKELVIHSTIEEELFYPVARTAIEPAELINEAEVEHSTTKYLIQQLLPTNKDDARFCAKVRVLREYVKHHLDEEEKDIFPKVKKAKLDLSALGQQLRDRRDELRGQLKTAENIVAFEPVKYFVGKG